jgi:hypothetical protein
MAASSRWSAGYTAPATKNSPLTRARRSPVLGNPFRVSVP